MSQARIPSSLMTISRRWAEECEDGQDWRREGGCTVRWRRGGPRAHAIVVLNLPVPDDRRVWAQALALRDAGHRVLVVCPSMRGHRVGIRPVDGVEVCYLPMIEGRGPFGVVAEGVWNSALAVLSLVWMRWRGASSVQVCNPPDSLFILLWTARRLGLGTLYDQHDLVPAMASARPGFGWLRPLLERCERWTVANADLVSTTSSVQRDRLHDLYGLSATLIRSATHLDGPRPPPAGSDIRLGYLGVIGEQEGLDDLLEAFAAARSRGAIATLSIAGDGPYLAEVQRTARSLGLTDVVDFPGWLRGDELVEFLDSIDAMVVSDPSSEYNHACAMNKVIEAMALGRPVLMRPLEENCRLTGDHPWIATGFDIEELASVIVDFSTSDAVERSAVGARLRARYESEAAWDDHAARYVDAIGSLTEARRRGWR